MTQKKVIDQRKGDVRVKVDRQGGKALVIS